MDWTDEPDERVLGALGSDPGALAVLYDRYARLVYGIAVAVLGNGDEAEDLVQEVFLTLSRTTTYDPARGAVPAYLTTLTRSRAIDRLRRRTRRVRLLRDWWQATPAVIRPPNPLERVSMAECAERVRAAMQSLSDNERRVLELAYWQGLTQAEIADDLGAPLGSVKSWCRRGLQGLKRALGDLVE